METFCDNPEVFVYIWNCYSMDLIDIFKEIKQWKFCLKENGLPGIYS